MIDPMDRLQDRVDEQYQSWMQDEIVKIQMAAEKPKKLAKEVA